MEYKTLPDRIRDIFLITFSFVFLYTIVAGLNYDINYWETNCYKELTIQEIHKARHRTVWVTLSDGTERELSQPKPAVYPGAPYCVDRRRERNDVELSWWMTPVKMFE